MSEDGIGNEIGFIIIILFVMFGGIMAIGYSGQTFLNQAKSEVFQSITNQTTNAEIVAKIHSVCSTHPWYYTNTECESTMLKSFIITAKGGN